MDEEIDVNEREIESALRRIPDHQDRHILQNYIRYLERVHRK
ncbi:MULTISPECIES: hypothetical protein [unclassified Anoxybacillus]|nr:MULTISPECIES: hypothetical protein [unclassified Anoxybacillus]